MTVVVVSLVVLVVLMIAAFVFVGWRDRKRLSLPEDSAAARDARSTQERYAADRHGDQDYVRRRIQSDSGV